MTHKLGSFCLVLHGHLPYVLRHGLWPHGEDWLYEAAAETYLPLLSAIDECAFLNAPARITVGLTPVLLEQLAHDHFKRGFEAYLADRIDRAKSDRADFVSMNNQQMAQMASWWENWFTQLSEQFAKLDRDIPRAYAQRAQKGLIEILTSNATHAYMPLLLEDSSIRAQIRAGIASSKRILGFAPRGMWLPECAYRPSGPWSPPIPWGDKAFRPGIEHLVADEGVTHFFVEHHLVEQSRSEYVRNNHDWQKVGWDEAAKYPGRGWRNVHEVHGVNSDGHGVLRTHAFARDPRVCEQVWSGAIGYPADGIYLEFHRKWGEKRGLRYWKVTGPKVDLGDKHLYDPADVETTLHHHAQHFCQFVKQQLRDYQQRTGRCGMVTACFDAELFGHWWFEGPRFLRDVILTLNADPEVELTTTSDYLTQHPPDKMVSLPEGSWGEGGDHRVWTDDQVKWMWEVEYRCETQFGKATYHLPWRKDENVRKLLEKAGRELLLLQASDWPFAITRGQAVDYGIKRFVQHVARFESLIDIAEKSAENSAYLNQLTDVQRFEIQDAELHDVIFPHIDLNWWNV